MTTYFHLCGVQLLPGSVIGRGNYGRILNTYGHFNNNAVDAWKFALEHLFDGVRLEQFPLKPSRLTSSFTFFTEQDARSQAGRLGGQVAILYEVELTDPHGPQHVGIFDSITSAYVPDGRAISEKARAIATDYWQGFGIGTRELVADSDLKIVRRV